MTTRKAFAYLRVSGRGQLDGDGFDRQRQAIEGFARRSGLQIVEEFREQAVSGATELDDRPALMTLFSRIVENGVRVVIVERADRLARDLMVQEAILKQFITSNVQVLTADGLDLSDNSDPMRTLIRQIVGAIAEFDKRTTVLKLRVARTRERKKNGYCEGRKPYGTQPGEPEIVDRMRALRSRRWSFARIAEAFNAEGLFNRQGRPWSAYYVRHVLRRAAELERRSEKFSQDVNAIRRVTE